MLGNRLKRSTKSSNMLALEMEYIGVGWIDNYDPIDPPAVVLLSQARYERDLLNWTRAVNLTSQQLSALCAVRGVIVPLVAEQPPNSSQPPHTQTSPTEA
ncbi:unnamed protein product [Microthlaspi erraticum]|uniref:Uncharacterized protein n=1 Tax=Microthlaspi erraticum TaxID=1685480 RepID=A0A6D2IM12_9BRAS|nr:unnamed protein product [Microthlaspi erraticum]